VPIDDGSFADIWKGRDHEHRARHAHAINGV